MNYPSPLHDAILVRRYKRFLADVELPGGDVITAWCPNPGAMTSCVADRAPVRLSYTDNTKRKLNWTLEQVQVGGTWIMVYTSRANDVVAEALASGTIRELAGYGKIARERRYGSSRFDFELSGHPERADAFVEVKNVTLVELPWALFPDAVSTRSTKHLRGLADVARSGLRAVQLYHVGRGDADRVAPASAVDPDYDQALREAMAAGVEVLAYRCDVGADALTLTEQLPFSADRALTSPGPRAAP